MKWYRKCNLLYTYIYIYIYINTLIHQFIEHEWFVQKKLTIAVKRLNHNKSDFKHRFFGQFFPEYYNQSILDTCTALHINFENKYNLKSFPIYMIVFISLYVLFLQRPSLPTPSLAPASLLSNLGRGKFMWLEI